MNPFSPQVIFSKYTRERCVSNFKELFSLADSSNVKVTASVLAPLCEVDGEVSLLFTVRSLNLKSHSGQISFPGGKQDKGETTVQTALRETYEELGIPSDNIEIWGELPAIQGRNTEMIIIPWVGRIINFDFNALKPSPDEVEEVFAAPLRSLCDTKNHAHWPYKGLPTPIYEYKGHKIWGLTAVVTHILLQNLVPEVYKPDFQRKKYEMNDLIPSKL